MLASCAAHRPLWLAAFAWSCSGPVDDHSCNNTFFADADGDGYGDSASPTTACAQPDGYAAASEDCNDVDAAVHPGADELCNDIDDDCDADIDEDAIDVPSWYVDVDHDGFGSGVAIASCTPPGGYVGIAGDCAEDDAQVNPAADELCNDIDDDCDGLTDSLDPNLVQGTPYYEDADGDGFGDPSTAFHSCEPIADGLLDGTDCDDADVLVHPLADEVCDHVDNDCDGLLDSEDDGILDASTFYADVDGDLVGNDDKAIVECFAPPGYVPARGDCDDNDTTVGASPDYYEDVDGDGYGNGAPIHTCNPKFDLALANGDCYPTDSSSNPGSPEVCDNRDNNCDGLIDLADPLLVATTWYADDDDDGYGDATRSYDGCDGIVGYVLEGTDCDDADGAIHPSALEFCDGIDNDCDATVDGLVAYVDWYADDDGDGYGDPDDVKNDCAQPLGYVAQPTDCDDTSGTIHPAGTDICATGVDEDCDDSVDNCLLPSLSADSFVEGIENPVPWRAAGIGASIAALDLNADGIADLVASHWGWNAEGRVYVAYGPMSADTSIDDMVTLSSDVDDGHFGWELDGGDVDDDGVDDLLVGAAQGSLASAYLFLGPVTSDGDRDDADAVLEGEPATAAGSEVDIIADFDGDYAADLVVGAPEDHRDAGAVYVISGPVSGTLGARAEATYVYEGAARSGQFGWENESVGDTNGDGVDDLALAAIGEPRGTVYIMDGAGTPGTYAVEAIAAASLIGPRIDSWFGYALASADANGDGEADLFVGATSVWGTSGPDVWATSGTDTGAVYMFLGPLSGALTVADAEATWVADLEVETLGQDLAAGDVDGDKRADLLMGAFDSYTLDGGAVFVQLGVASGTVDVRTLPVISGEPYDALGLAIALVPDWTGDDGAEVALGGQTHRDASGQQVGALYVFDSERFYR